MKILELLNPKRFDLLVRNAGAFTVVVVAGYTLVQIAYASNGLKGYVNFGLMDWWMNPEVLSNPQAKAVLLVICAVLFGFYLIFFLSNTHPKTLIRPKPINILFLGLQSIVTCSVSLILLLLTDVLVGFLLPGGWGLLWIFIHSLADFFITLYSPKNGLIQQWLNFSNQTPLPLEALFSFLSSIAAQFLCYSIGKMGAMELRQRLELSRINAELQATRLLQSETARLAERVFISREIHDSLGHYLTALSLNLQLAIRLSNPEAKRPLEESQMIAKLLLNDVRDVVSSLRESISLDLEVALQTLVSGIQSPTVHLKIDGVASNLEPAYANTLFRCIQEGLTNSIRHANAQNIWITLISEPEILRLNIQDDGMGNDAIQKGNGLKGMEERLVSVQGILMLKDNQPKGLYLQIEIPRMERLT